MVQQVDDYIVEPPLFSPISIPTGEPPFVAQMFADHDSICALSACLVACGIADVGPTSRAKGLR